MLALGGEISENPTESVEEVGVSSPLQQDRAAKDEEEQSIAGIYASSEDDRASIDNEITYPEGGLRAWLVVVGSFFGLTTTFGLSVALGTIQTYIVQHQLRDFSESQVSWIFSLWLFGMYTGSIQVGPLFDQYGFRALAVPGSILYVVSIMLLSVCTEFYQFVLGFSVLGGITSAMVFNPSVAVVGHYFYKRRAFATSLALTGAGIGGVVFPFIMTRLFKQVGYGWAVRILGFIILGMQTVNCLLCSARKLRKPEDKRGAMIDFKSLMDIQLMAISLGVFMLEWAFYSPVGYLVLYSEHFGFGSSFGNQLISIMAAGSVLGRILPGYLADKLGCFNVSVAMHFMSGVVTLAVWLPAGHHRAGLIVFAALFGLFSGACAGLIPACIGKISDTRQYGTRYGTCYFIVSISILTGLPISGALKGSDFIGTIVFTGVTMLVASACMLVARLARGHHRQLNY